MSRPLRRSAPLLLVLATGGCEYVAGLGLLGLEYREEQREQNQRLEQCGPCPDGERCNLLMDPGECRPLHGAVGDPCGAWKGRITPEHQFDCAEPLVCNQALEPDACAPLGQAGTACSHSGECDASTWCVEWVCVPTLAIGAECLDDDACRPNTCLQATHTCERPRSLGEPCVDGLDCAGELGCDAGRCVDPMLDR